MMEKNVVKKIVAAIQRNRKESLLDRSIMHPQRDWTIGVLVAIGVIAVVAYSCIAVYVKYGDVSVVGTTGTDGATVYQTPLVEAALAELATRADEYDRLRKKLQEDSLQITTQDEITPPTEGGEVASSTNTTGLDVSRSTDVDTSVGIEPAAESVLEPATLDI